MRTAGIDGCKGGWIAVVIDDRGARERRMLKHAGEIAALEAERILIDIPIGLPQSGRRASDVAARHMLGPAWPRIFVDARRPLLAFAEYDAANAWAKADGNGISRQLWNILPKIGDVDRVIEPRAQRRILEAHPELAFARMNGAVVREGKKTSGGCAIRARLLHKAGFADIEKWMAALRGTGAGPDDLLDACALAVAARDPQRVVCAREKDARGLRMDIWY